MKRGRFITFEGVEGSGKSTHIRALARRLETLGHHVLCVREPGGTRTGEAIRRILQHDETGEPIAPRTELLLFAACRAQLVEQVIRPALRRGTWVLCDRFADSTVAYQGYGRGLPLKMVEAVNRCARDGCRPDLTILMDVEVGRGRNRLARRNRRAGGSRDRIEREAAAFHERVRQGYLRLAHHEPRRIRIVSSSGPVRMVEEAVWSTVRDVLKPESR